MDNSLQDLDACILCDLRLLNLSKAFVLHLKNKDLMGFCLIQVRSVKCLNIKISMAGNLSKQQTVITLVAEALRKTPYVLRLTITL